VRPELLVVAAVHHRHRRLIAIGQHSHPVGEATIGQKFTTLAAPLIHSLKGTLMTTRFPLADAAKSAATLWTAVGGIVTGLAGVGIITADQNTALQAVLVAVTAVVGGVTSALAAFGVKRQAEPLVTPLADPRNNLGEELLPAKREY
jgi:hypothetical protein